MHFARSLGSWRSGREPCVAHSMRPCVCCLSRLLRSPPDPRLSRMQLASPTQAAGTEQRGALVSGSSREALRSRSSMSPEARRSWSLGGRRARRTSPATAARRATPRSGSPAASRSMSRMVECAIGRGRSGWAPGGTRSRDLAFANGVCGGNLGARRGVQRPRLREDVGTELRGCSRFRGRPMDRVRSTRVSPPKRPRINHDSTPTPHLPQVDLKSTPDRPRGDSAPSRPRNHPRLAPDRSRVDPGSALDRPPTPHPLARTHLAPSPLRVFKHSRHDRGSCGERSWGTSSGHEPVALTLQVHHQPMHSGHVLRTRTRGTHGMHNRPRSGCALGAYVRLRATSPSPPRRCRRHSPQERRGLHTVRLVRALTWRAPSSPA